ncbi:MAG: tripartite tricarboxylate transporter substrate binding protein [Betaproteobacteria bacterium]|nr:tripartite tricarboxylate transporter substrate binding protein [Betaproteobacteria bacterium]
MRNVRNLSVLFSMFVSLSLGWAAAATAQNWPNKPVRIVVGFGAGGTADVLARLLIADLTKVFGEQFIVENRPGSGGAVGSAVVVRAEPDGYTLLIGGAGPHLVGPAVNKNIEYRTMRDFTHVAMIAGDSAMLAASPALGVNSLADLIKVARDKDVTAGTPGVGSQGHLIVELINQTLKIRLVPVAYKGAAEAMSDLIGNHVSLALQPAISVGAHVQARKAVGLGVTSPARNPIFSSVPTFAELGYPQIRGTSWFWLTGPANVPAPVVERLNREVRKIINSPDIEKQFAKLALLKLDLDVPALNKFLAEEVALWGGLAEKIGLQVQ